MNDKPIPDILLDLMEWFGILGNDEAAKECLEAYLKYRKEENHV